MVETFVIQLRELIERTLPARDRTADIECKHFFSGAAAYADGNIFMSLTPVGLALKLPEDACAVLKKQGAKPLKYFPKAPIKKDYVILPRSVLEDDAALSKWLRASVEYCGTR